MKTYVGKVISDKANKTILVAVDRWMVVPKYKKKIKRTSKFMAHDENNDCRMGDIVRIHISRPLSKNKTWRMTDILRRERVYDAEAAGGLAEKSAAPSTTHLGSINRGFAASAAL
ncbi:probable 30S ribosomal protein S17 [Coccomyxa sp. Obi]|nr:probable 30S ribosomal protein S17 [Coccomyxa sp. Obi]